MRQLLVRTATATLSSCAPIGTNDRAIRLNAANTGSGQPLWSKRCLPYGRFPGRSSIWWPMRSSCAGHSSRIAMRVRDVIPADAFAPGARLGEKAHPASRAASFGLVSGQTVLGRISIPVENTAVAAGATAIRLRSPFSPHRAAYRPAGACPGSFPSGAWRVKRKAQIISSFDALTARSRLHSNRQSG